MGRYHLFVSVPIQILQPSVSADTDPALISYTPFHPSIVYRFIHLRVTGGWSQSQLTLGERRGSVCGPYRRATYRDKQPFTLTFTPTVNSIGVSNEPNPILHVSGLWEEAREPRENPRIHGENMQTPNRKPLVGLNRDSNLEPSCCEAKVLTTTPPCSTNLFPTGKK